MILAYSKLLYAAFMPTRCFSEQVNVGQRLWNLLEFTAQEVFCSRKVAEEDLGIRFLFLGKFICLNGLVISLWQVCNHSEALVFLTTE